MHDIIGSEFFRAIKTPGDEPVSVEGEQLTPSDLQSSLLCSRDASEQNWSEGTSRTCPRFLDLNGESSAPF